MKRTRLTAVALAGLWACASASALLLDDASWQEGPVPAPPSFSTDRLLRFEVNRSSSLVFGIDPQTLSISPDDRVVRYVVVASSPSGAHNALYEGIRCATAEVKTYARHSGQQWVMASDPQWQPMATRPSRHAQQLARQGACDNAGTPLRAEDVLRALRQQVLPAGL